jgi:hypothetical protein
VEDVEKLVLKVVLFSVNAEEESGHKCVFDGLQALEINIATRDEIL